MTKADITWLDKPQIFGINKLKPHADFIAYKNLMEIKEKKSSLYQTLNGIWKFHYSENASKRPARFFEDISLCESYIEVPSHIELSGYDQIHYINTMYPWEGWEYRRPPVSDDGCDQLGMFSAAKYNPVGSYVKLFDLSESLKGQQIILRFEGVEQAMYIWLNGEFVGYSEDSFGPAEFDVTNYIREKENVLAVEVHKRSTAAFLEDQDFFRFFGIFRNVMIYGKQKDSVEDLWIKTDCDLKNKLGKLECDIKFCTDGDRYLQLEVKDKNDDVIFLSNQKVTGKAFYKEIDFEQVELWEYQSPSLYTVQVTILNLEKEVVEIIPYKTGFRKIEIRNGVIYLNDKRLLIKGVNRHEWSAEKGRAIGAKEMESDMACLLKNNINAVRTSHYPNQPQWYSMCDEAGIYMMAECNLESHGSWQKMGAVEPSWNVPGDWNVWREAVLDRAERNFHVFKNHISILFWSLGNESYAGENIKLMNKMYKEKDSSRLVHYEGVFHCPEYKEYISDVESHMYSSPNDIARYLENSPKKPFLICEFMHCMGNSGGGFGKYMELFDKYPMYQGGFIWDLIDQALLFKDKTSGKMVMKYGGDFDDRPSDYDFSGDGLLFADRVEKPVMQEVRYYYGRKN